MLQKIVFAAKWIGLFLGVMLVAMVLGPLFLSNHQRALHLSAFLNHYRIVFLLIHAAFIWSVLWFWPAYIRAKGARNHWSEDMINQASSWKWAVMLVLACLCVLFFIS
jgi:hypothetical protein